MNDPVDINTTVLKKRLLQRQISLQQTAASAKSSLQPVELDQSRVGRLSRMDALQMQAMAQAEAGRRNLELTRIEGALARIELDDYGFCMICDEPIAPKRLQLDPAVMVCILCAKAAEERG